MNIEKLRNYCLAKPHTIDCFPFDETTLVFKVVDKMFALTSLKGWEEATPSINLKCNPNYAIELRATYEGVQPGYHMSKVHWNTVTINTSDVNNELLLQLIDDSYQLVTQSFSKKKQKEMGFIK